MIFFTSQKTKHHAYTILKTKNKNLNGNRIDEYFNKKQKKK